LTLARTHDLLRKVNSATARYVSSRFNTAEKGGIIQ
jgi:hypothetical protein